MTGETAFLCAAAVTLAVSLAVVLYLERPLRRVLIDLCGTEDRARFWSAFANVVHLLVPLTVVMLTHASPASDSSPVLAIVDLVRWPLVGLIASVASVALGVALFVGAGGAGGTIHLDRDQFDDLQRLLAKVQELRAREVIRQSTHQSGPAA